MILTATILGEPVAKGRPRVVRRGGFARAITPEKTRTWEANAAAQLAEAWGDRPPIDEPVNVAVVAVKSRPKRLLRRKDPDGRMYRETKPDLDNVIKAAADALVAAGVLRDDTLMVSPDGSRSLFAARGEGPRVEITVGPPGAIEP